MSKELKQLIQYWQIFVQEWFEKEPVQKYGDTVGKLKPDFYNFMEWLSHQ